MGLRGWTSRTIADFSQWLRETSDMRVQDYIMDDGEVLDIILSTNDTTTEELHVEAVNFYDRALHGMCAICGQYPYTHVTHNLGNYLYAGVCNICQTQQGDMNE